MGCTRWSAIICNWMPLPDIFTCSGTAEKTASNCCIGISYAIPSGEPGLQRFEITIEELSALLSGIDLSTAVRRKRYRRASV
jgi:hypothetical protein